MTWNEITKAYPDKWTVLSDDEVNAYEINNHGKGYKYRGTTEGLIVRFPLKAVRDHDYIHSKK